MILLILNWVVLNGINDRNHFWFRFIMQKVSEPLLFSALDIISDAAMGVQLDAQMKNPDSLNYVKNRDEATSLIIQRFRTIWLIGNFLYYNFTPSGLREKNLIRGLQKFTENVIVQRWKELQENIEEFQRKKRNSFLDLMLLGKQENNLSFDDIREEVDTFMFEG